MLSDPKRAKEAIADMETERKAFNALVEEKAGELDQLARSLDEKQNELETWRERLIGEHNGTAGSETQTDKTSGTMAHRERRARRQYLDLKAYSDGSSGFGTGIKLWNATDATYSTPEVPAEANDPPQHDVVAMTDFFTRTSVSPVDLGTGPYTGTGQKGDYLVLCMEVEPAATQGALATETTAFAYDEI